MAISVSSTAAAPSSSPLPESAAYELEVRRCVEVLNQLDVLRPADVVRKSHPCDATPLVTLMVPMLNASPFVERCLKGLLAQTHSNLEVFCVDDHSDDDTYERTVALFGEDSRVCVVRLSRTVGPFQIKNWVLSRLARGEFIAMQDADDVSHPARIAAQVARLVQTGAGVCGTCVHQSFVPNIAPRFGERWVPVEGDTGCYHSLAIYKSVPTAWLPASFGEILGDDGQFHFVKHGTQLFRRSVLIAFGGFDGSTRMGADLDLNWRLLRFMPILNLPHRVVLEKTSQRFVDSTSGHDLRLGAPRSLGAAA